MILAGFSFQTEARKWVKVVARSNSDRSVITVSFDEPPPELSPSEARRLGRELIRLTAKTVDNARYTVLADPQAKALHDTDADCAPHIDADGQCSVCGVSHTATCPGCGGRGFHKPTCLEDR
jgi:hypothetical protein